MQDPTLLIMAAGIGSRYGGLKQIDPVGPNGEIILDYSIYDALRAGFRHLVFLIRRDIEDAFRQKVGRAVEERVETTYVFQELEDLPSGFTVPARRVKPWGTGHAVFCCKDTIHTSFAVINADDYYGPGAFRYLAQHFETASDEEGRGDYCMVGYRLENTLSDHGHVARGVCTTTPEGYLTDIRERTKIKRLSDGIKYTEDDAEWIGLPGDCIVSMNMWGFTPSIFGQLESRFTAFLSKNSHNLEKVEYYLPEVVGALLREGKARVTVLPTGQQWFGVTYPEDRARVQATMQDLVMRGVYPANLWETGRL